MRIPPIGLCLVFILAPAALDARTAVDDFTQSCSNCHTIGGGRLTGPDLKNVTQRRERAWLVRLITNPKAMQASGDPTFADLFKEYRGVLMMTPPDMTPERAENLIRLIEQESALAKSRFAGSQLIDRPLTETDVQLGHSIFVGTRRLQKGGPSCMSCHSVGGLTGMGGGRLGPDLTGVFSQLGGIQPLAAWLAGPATPTMRGLFNNRPLAPEEILPLVAYLKKEAETQQPADWVGRLIFIILGLAGVLLVLIVLDKRWGNRLGRRSPSVQKEVDHGF